MEGYIAEIRMFGGNFAPRGWFFCQGQLLSIAQWTAVFALLGTTYGGNGQTTFGLPDFRGRVGISPGQGPGLPPVDLGEMAGTPSTTLTPTQIAAHIHFGTATAADATSGKPAGKFMANSSSAIYAAPTDGTVMGPTALTGGSQPFSITQPYLGMNYIICVEGIFPSRN